MPCATTTTSTMCGLQAVPRTQTMKITLSKHTQRTSDDTDDTDECSYTCVKCCWCGIERAWCTFSSRLGLRLWVKWKCVENCAKYRRSSETVVSVCRSHRLRARFSAMLLLVRSSPNIYSPRNCCNISHFFSCCSSIFDAVVLSISPNTYACTGTGS